ncbi:MAG: Gx transporter family protein [Roseburia sp.]|nr:Gx transporter family protein [Anaeroplasma bactoclasticum]MCM1197242.1 Gx transporter family protein [Roseburia sp.]MCM1556092.1 Gx transporter family protein [Anaeroplasma bactoclasticum]
MSKTKRLCIISMLLAMAIVLNILESFIPFGIPGVKLGLANIIILIMLYEFKPYEALAVNILRILLVGLLRGNFLSPTFIMSLSGGMLSFLVMYLFSRIKVFSPIGVSVLGAVSHATGQVIAAIILLGTQAVLYYLPLIGLLSIGTGIISGIITRLYLKKSITARFIEKSAK